MNERERKREEALAKVREAVSKIPSNNPQEWSAGRREIFRGDRKE